MLVEIVYLLVGLMIVHSRIGLQTYTRAVCVIFLQAPLLLYCNYLCMRTQIFVCVNTFESRGSLWVRLRKLELRATTGSLKELVKAQTTNVASTHPAKWC